MAAPPVTGPIEILHAGEIFTGRSLVPVLEAAARLRQRHPGRPVRIVTYGALPPQETDRIRAAGLEDFIEVRQRVPFSALFAELKRAHLLLAIVGDHMLYSTPYKVYDYMAAGRPILGLAPRGAALFELLADSGAGVCVEPGDAAGIERALGQFMIGEVVPARARVERFHWAVSRSNTARSSHRRRRIRLASLSTKIAHRSARCSTTEVRWLRPQVQLIRVADYCCIAASDGPEQGVGIAATKVARRRGDVRHIARRAASALICGDGHRPPSRAADQQLEACSIAGNQSRPARQVRGARRNALLARAALPKHEAARSAGSFSSRASASALKRIVTQRQTEG
jgi:hypothetical protein